LGKFYVGSSDVEMTSLKIFSHFYLKLFVLIIIILDFFVESP